MTDTARRVRMRDVAALAGVGTKTVSRVMNGEPNVSARTSEKVRAAVAALDYQVDPFARNLRRLGRRTNSIALLIGAVDNPFSGGIGRAVEVAALERHTVLLTSSLHIDPSREQEVVGELLRRRVDGLLLTTATHSLAAVTAAHDQGTAVVFVDGPPMGVAADAVLSDNRAGAAMATRHLLEAGHRRIAYVGARHDVHTIAERRAGYEEELARWHLPLDPSIVIEDVEREDARAAVRELLARGNGPDAIFSSQNETTVGVIGAMHDAGCQHDVALVGFDDFLTADLLDPAITVMAQDPETIGAIAAELLFRRIDGDTGPVKTTLVPVKLIERGSGEIRPQPRSG